MMIKGYHLCSALLYSITVSRAGSDTSRPLALSGLFSNVCFMLGDCWHVTFFLGCIFTILQDFKPNQTKNKQLGEWCCPFAVVDVLKLTFNLGGDVWRMPC